VTGGTDTRDKISGSTNGIEAGGAGSARTLAGPGSASESATGAKPASKRDDLLAKNALVDRNGVRVLSSQITAREYELVIGSVPAEIAKPADPEAPLPSLTQQEAAAFCAAIGMRLPTSDEWAQATKGAWGIAVDAVAGPLQEWTSTIQDELAVVRGGHSAMPQASLDKAARSKPPYFLQKEVAGATFDRKIVSSPTIGFRCVDGPVAPAKSEAVAVTPTKPAKPAKPAGTADRSSGTYQMVKPMDLSSGTMGRKEAEPVGNLEKSVISKFIGRYKGKIAYCYEKVLLNKPDLTGTVTVNFTITPEGTVRSARASGMDADVASCVEKAILTVQFPKPKGNGVVTVTYPFTFRPAAAD
jgi:hypothetical protein